MVFNVPKQTVLGFFLFDLRFKTNLKISLFIFVNNCSFMLNAQQKTILLSNYTFSGKGRVGYISIPQVGSKNTKLKLTGKDADLFKITGKNGLFFKGDAQQSIEKWYDITIETIGSGKEYTVDFRIVKDEFLKNKVIAHRGAWKNTATAENSIQALNNAINLGCAGSEFDVHMSADSILFVYHDAVVNGFHIEKTFSDELLRVKLSNGESLPILEHYLTEGMVQNNTKLILEIKPSEISTERGLATTRKVMELVQKMKAQAWVDYISFDYEICKEIKLLDANARVAYLKGDKTPEELLSDKIWGLDYNQSVLKKNEAWIDNAHTYKLTVNAWTVNDKETMNWLLKKSVDFITTNEPELLLSIIKMEI